MERLVRYFTQGTQDTHSGGKIGLEVETDFLDEERRPISEHTATQLLALTPPDGYSLKLELGRQKLELNVAPQATFEQAWEKTRAGLKWLYVNAEQLGAFPYFAPEIHWPDDLLWVQEERDELWVGIDGRPALEHLCRCSSIQFTIDVNPKDAISWINRLLDCKIQELDYVSNHTRWQSYIASSNANYRFDRYAGPNGFDDLEDYISQIARHDVVMHKGEVCWRKPEAVDDLNIDLYLRSIWWHYRLRRYGQTLALELRPLSRRADEDIPNKWNIVRQVLGL